MALYSYKAIDENGKSVKGLQDAANLIDLEQRLKRSGIDLINGKEEESKATFGVGKIKRPDLITFFFNLEQLARAGVPLLECLGDLRDSMEEAAFGEITVSLTSAGEESGRLDDVFKHLTESLKWQD